MKLLKDKENAISKGFKGNLAVFIADLPSGALI
jgi:hypothetical protein